MIWVPMCGGGIQGWIRDRMMLGGSGVMWGFPKRQRLGFSPSLTHARARPRCSNLLSSRPAHPRGPRVVRLSLREEPVVGLPGERPARPPCHHPHLHGPADHSRHRQQEGAQAAGERGLVPRSGAQHRVGYRLHPREHLLWGLCPGLACSAKQGLTLSFPSCGFGVTKPPGCEIHPMP